MLTSLGMALGGNQRVGLLCECDTKPERARGSGRAATAW